MNRTGLVITLALSLLAASLAAEAQPAGRTPRLCFLTFDPGTAQSPSPRFDGFFQGLRDLGYVHGQTLSMDYLTAEGDGNRFPALAADCVRLQADIIAVTTTPAAQAAKSATRTIPIVMVSVGDPVGTGLVASLARPEGNVTGMSYMTTGLAAKRLELLKEAVPGISRVLVLSYLVDPIAPLQVKALQEAALLLGVTLLIRDIRTAADLQPAFATGVKDRVDGLIITSESIFRVERAQVTQLAARHRLPAVYPFSAMAEENGGLMAYLVDEHDIHRRAATYVDRLLKGAKPAALAVQQPARFKLIVNLKTAKALGLTIPPAVLARADEIIE
jgi:putative ABC transport system substrate-binding protein